MDRDNLYVSVHLYSEPHMTLITTVQSTVANTVQGFGDDWCVYRHIVPSNDGTPPSIIYIGCCKLTKLYDMTDARRNSEWRKLMTLDRALIVEIIAIGNKRECYQHRGRVIATSNPRPHCNVRGFDTTGAAVKIHCSNGAVYATQTEAATALQLSQSAISRHLAGDPGVATVKGYTFWRDE